MNVTQTKIHQFDLFINGRIVPPKQNQYFNSINPSTGKIFARVANASQEEINDAVRAARQAFDHGDWSQMTILERGIYLKKIAQLIRKHAKELAELESMDTGKTSKQSTLIDVPTCADTYEYFGGISDLLPERSNPVNAPVQSVTHREPVGVVVCIIPWNYPLIMSAWKIAPALMAGNTVVLKPSPLASVSVLRLAQIMSTVGLPAGVLNIVTSDRNEVAAELVRNSDVGLISFSGGTFTGRGILKNASQNVTRTILELGGKSANIVLADCDMDAAIGGTMAAIFMNQGQMCTACSRLLLDERIYDQFFEKLVERTNRLTIGDAASYETQFGPIISEEHRDRILEFINQAVQEGARVVCGGKVPQGEQYSQGFYMEPTILVDVKNSMTVAQEEIFGPVLCVMSFCDEAQAVDMANDSKYGLAASIWTKDQQKAKKMARQLQCGTVWINTYGGFYNEASFGGYKQSGYGRELGIEGMYEFTQTKHICMDQTPGGRPLVSGWF